MTLSCFPALRRLFLSRRDTETAFDLVHGGAPLSSPSNSERISSLVEQTLLSTTNFLALIYLGRRLSATAFGVYALALAIQLFVAGVQRARLALPLVVFASTVKNLREQLPYWRRLHWRLQAGAVCILLFVAGTGTLLGASPWTMHAFVLGALITPPMLFHELRRRITIQSLRVLRLPAMALTYSIVHLGSLWILIDKWPSAIMGAICIGAASTAAGVVSPRVALDTKSDQDPDDFAAFVRSTKSFSLWALAGHVAYTAYNGIAGLLLSLIAGPTAVAHFAATQVMLKPIQTLIQAVDSVDKPAATRAVNEGGYERLILSLRHTRRTLLVLGLPYLIAASLLGDRVLILAYKDRYVGSSSLIYMWSAVMLFQLLGQPLESGLLVLRRPDMLLYGRIIGAFAGLLASSALIPMWGAKGAVAAICLGWAFSSAMSYIFLDRETSMSISYTQNLLP